MDRHMHLLKSAQARFLGLLAALWLGVFLITRSILLLTHLSEAQLSPGGVLFRNCAGRFT